MLNRFHVGDIIEVRKYYDQGDERWKSGIVHITEYNPNCKHTKYGIYSISSLRGDIGWISINAQLLDTMDYVVWLGNIKEDRILRLLYGT